MTARFCATCGTPTAPDGRFCANCGRDLGLTAALIEQPTGPTAAGEAVVEVATTPEVSAPSAGEAPGASSETPAEGPGTPVKPPSPFAAAGAVVPASNPPTVSGRALAGLLAGLTAIGILAAIFFFVNGRGGSASATPAPQPQPTPQPAPAPQPPAPQPNPPAPTGGWPRNQIVPKVGPFRLVGVKRDPSLISGAITDAYIATYKTVSGVRVYFAVFAAKSKSTAKHDVRAIEAHLIKKRGFMRAEPDFNVREKGTNKVLGVGAHLVKGGEEILAWSNGKLSLAAEGPKPYSIGFYNKSEI